MVITGIIYALITAACWGSISVVSHKIGGSSQNQILGESYGILLFALVYYFIEQPTINLETMLVGVAGLYGETVRRGATLLLPPCALQLRTFRKGREQPLSAV